VNITKSDSAAIPGAFGDLTDPDRDLIGNDRRQMAARDVADLL
jgi:hypothetical protein